MKKRLLILGGSHFQVPFIMKAKELGAYVGVVDIKKDAPGKTFADVFYNCSLLEKERVLEIATSFIADGIAVGTCEVGVNTAAYVAEKLSLPFLSRAVARCATNKIQMIEAFYNHGVAAPKYEVLRPGDTVKTELSFPVIIKPADKSASRGICYVAGPDDLERAVTSSMAISDSKEVIVQEYLEGPEISIELGVEADTPIALQVTDKITNGAPHYVEIGQSQPASLSETVIKEAVNLACSAAKAVGLENCAGHAEMKITPSGLKMIEIAGRMGGHYIDADLLENSTGWRLQEAIIKYALGEEFKILKNAAKGPTAMKCILSKQGTVLEIHGLEKARNIEGIIKVVISCKPGDTLRNTISNNDLVGYVVARADSTEKALSICDQALEQIIISYSKNYTIIVANN